MDKIKNAIIKWLGFDYVINKLDNLSEDLYQTDWSEHINYRELERELEYHKFGISASDVAAEEFDTEDIAYNVDYTSLASELDSYDIASCVEMSDLAQAY